MKTRLSPPPVHVHVPETTPVHVHMRRSPSRASQKLVDVKTQKPWIPPGRLSCRRAAGPHQDQTSRGQCHTTEREARRQRDEEEREEELSAVSKNLSVLLNEQAKKEDSRGPLRKADVLLRALVEAEIDGVAVANQLTSLKQSVDSFAKERRLPPSLAHQQQLLLEKIAMFDRTNQGLRGLLREWSEQQGESLLWSEQRDAIKKRLVHSEAENMRLSIKLSAKEKEALRFTECLDLEKENVETTKELSKALEETHRHLESQLSRAEAEKVHLSAQIQSMQQSVEQQQEELRVLQEELQTARLQKEQVEREEQGTVAQLSQQVTQAEKTVRQLKEQLQEKESQLSQALSSSSDWCLRHSSEAAAKGQLEEQVSALRFQLTELNSELHSAEEKSRAEREELRDQIHLLSSENCSMKLDRQRLQVELTSREEKLRGVHSEARHLKSSIGKYEALVEKYKKKLQQARLLSEEQRVKLKEAQLSLQAEKEQLRRELLERLTELQALPERLRRTEEQLQEAQQEAHSHHRKNMENSSALAEVRHKVEQQGAELETFQNRSLLLHEENKVLKERILNLERNLEDVTLERKELSQTVRLKDASVQSLQQQLDEKTRECSVVLGQLQHAVDDAQRQVDSSTQRVFHRERESQSKALDLQNQLSRARTELNQLQRSKEEMEGRFHSQLQNLKERLEQSDSTNRSLQHYVHFLKTSYGNVFGDSFT